MANPKELFDAFYKEVAENGLDSEEADRLCNELDDKLELYEREFKSLNEDVERAAEWFNGFAQVDSYLIDKLGPDGFRMVSETHPEKNTIATIQSIFDDSKAWAKLARVEELLKEYHGDAHYDHSDKLYIGCCITEGQYEHCESVLLESPTTSYDLLKAKILREQADEAGNFFRAGPKRVECWYVTVEELYEEADKLEAKAKERDEVNVESYMPYMDDPSRGY